MKNPLFWVLRLDLGVSTLDSGALTLDSGVITSYLMSKKAYLYLLTPYLACKKHYKYILSFCIYFPYTGIITFAEGLK